MLEHLDINEVPQGLNGPGGGLGDVPLHVQDAVGLPVHYMDQELCLREVHPTFLVNMELGRDSKVCSVGEVSPPKACSCGKRPSSLAWGQSGALRYTPAWAVSITFRAQGYLHFIQRAPSKETCQATCGRLPTRASDLKDEWLPAHHLC